MSARRSAVLCVVLLTAAVAAGACAERQSEDQYQQNLTKLYAERQQVLRELPEQHDADVAFFADAQKRISTAASDLAAIQPPKHVQQAHDRHVEGLRGLSRLLGQLADCARLEQASPGGGRTCREQIDQADLDEVRNDLDEADTIYREQGFKLQEA